MRISKYNKELNKILSPDVIYKAEMKHTTWKRSGWDNDIEEYKFIIETKSEHELNTMIEKYLKDSYSHDGDFGISLNGYDYELIRKYTKQVSILD